MAKPDICVFTEYVEGPSHSRFLDKLAEAGLRHSSLPDRVRRHNQVLVVARERTNLGSVRAPDITPALPTNFHHVELKSLGLHVFGFRMPCSKNLGPKRATWEWLRSEALRFRALPCLIAGDFNTAPGRRACGQYLALLRSDGWSHALPEAGCSYIHNGRFEHRIDHAFLSPRLVLQGAEYSWRFLEQFAVSKTPAGTPDHAMHIVEFTVASPPEEVTEEVA